MGFTYWELGAPHARWWTILRVLTGQGVTEWMWNQKYHEISMGLCDVSKVRIILDGYIVCWVRWTSGRQIGLIAALERFESCSEVRRWLVSLKLEEIISWALPKSKSSTKGRTEKRIDQTWSWHDSTYNPRIEKWPVTESSILGGQ